MNKIKMTGVFDTDLTALLNALTRLPEDFGFIAYLKEDARLLKEHPQSLSPDAPSINEVYNKVWFENEVLNRMGYLKLTFHERAEQVIKTKKLIFNSSTKYGRVIDAMETHKRENYKPLSYFLEEASPVPVKLEKDAIIVLGSNMGHHHGQINHTTNESTSLHHPVSSSISASGTLHLHNSPSDVKNGDHSQSNNSDKNDVMLYMGPTVITPEGKELTIFDL